MNSWRHTYAGDWILDDWVKFIIVFVIILVIYLLYKCYKYHSRHMQRATNNPHNLTNKKTVADSIKILDAYYHSGHNLPTNNRSGVLTATNPCEHNNDQVTAAGSNAYCNPSGSRYKSESLRHTNSKSSLDCKNENNDNCKLSRNNDNQEKLSKQKRVIDPFVPD